MDKPTRPLCLEIEDATREISSVIESVSQKYRLPCYILEPIVSEVLTRLQNGKRMELETARQSYEQQLKAYEEG